MSGPHRVGLSSLDAALAWVDAAVHPSETEEAPLREAIGRVLTREIRTERPIPDCDSAALDGFAVAAEQTVGASSYNPLSLPLIELSAGEALPGGTDAVVPIEHGEPDNSGNVAVVEAWAAGSNVDRQGAVVTTAGILMPAGTMIAPRHIGILAATGFAHLPVVCRPRVEIVPAGVPRAGAPDSNGPMLYTLIERDGGTILEHGTGDRSRSALADTIRASRSDIVLVVGGTGPGRDDVSAASVAAAGELAIDGVALSPGGTAGLGRTEAGVPVVLLPAAPAACLFCYELFAGRAIRRLGGRDPETALPIEHADHGAQDCFRDRRDRDCSCALPGRLHRSHRLFLRDRAHGCGERRRLCHRTRDERGLSAGSLSRRVSIRRSLRPVSFVLPELHKAELTALAHGHSVQKTKRPFGF